MRHTGRSRRGEFNEDRLSALNGRWTKGRVWGRLVDEGWGADHGRPGIVFDGALAPVEVHVFTSTDLPAHWLGLDAFEGADYARTVVEVETDDGPVEAYIYALAR